MGNELIKIKNDNGKQLVSARELHEFLEVKSAFSTWFKRMIEYGFEKDIDFYELWSDSKNGNAVEYLGSPQKMSANGYELDYIITIDMAKELSMIQRTEKGKQARKYFIQCEKKLKEVASSQKALPQDYLSALKALVQAEEEKALMKPKVEYYENTLRPDTYKKLLTSTAIAKDLGMSAIKFNKILNNLDVIYKGKDKNWYLYSNYEDKIPEYADYIINEYGQQLRFTEKGREWIINLLKENKIIESV